MVLRLLLLQTFLLPASLQFRQDGDKRADETPRGQPSGIKGQTAVASKGSLETLGLCKSIRRILVDASVLKWGQIKTRKLALSFFNPPL